MENLAGVKECDKHIREELTKARIEIEQVKVDERTEVPFTLIGRLGRFKFWRAWRYWVVNGKVPLNVAQELCEDPIGKKDVRVEGDCGCPLCEEWISWYDNENRRLTPISQKPQDPKIWAIIKDDPTVRFVDDPSKEGKPFIKLYHIDSLAGLRLFADTVRKHNLC